MCVSVCMWLEVSKRLMKVLRAVIGSYVNHGANFLEYIYFNSMKGEK